MFLIMIYWYIKQDQLFCSKVFSSTKQELSFRSTYRKSRLFAISSSDITQGLSGVLLGSSLSWASVKEGTANECSTIKAWTSVSRSPIGPNEWTKWPFGYIESTSQWSILTTILWAVNRMSGVSYPCCSLTHVSTRANYPEHTTLMKIMSRCFYRPRYRCLFPGKRYSTSQLKYSINI